LKNNNMYKYKLKEATPSSAKAYQQKRIDAFDEIEARLNNLYPVISNAKNETAEYYQQNPGSYAVVKPTDLILDYIKDIEDLIKPQ